MNLWFRLIGVLIRSLWTSRIGPFDEAGVEFRVMPGDLDPNMHMTNARYLSLMDLGRVDLLVRTGLARLMLKHRIRPVIAGADVKFRRPLSLFQPLTVKSRLLGWDDRWFYVQQIVEGPSGLSCRAVFRTVFLDPRGRMDPAALARLIGSDLSSPALPAWVAMRRDLDTALDQAFEAV